MGDYFDWWMGGGDWYDRKQAEQIDALSSSHARATSRLSSKLAEERKRSDDLGARLSKLEDAVVAMVELEDLRGVMENFSDSAATRRYARDVLARIPALGRVPSTQDPQVPPDVPGYWLHPAVRAVDARLRGDGAGEAAAAAEARLRDPARTAQFFAAVAILLGSTVADDDLATLWPTSRQVSPYQRSLWLAVAGGALGDTARDTLVRSLRWVVQDSPRTSVAEDDAQRFVQVTLPAAAEPVDTAAVDLVRSAFVGRRSPSDPGAAATALQQMRERIDVALAPPEVPEGGAATVPDGVADLLAQVVSAGAPDEEPLVARLVEIRQALAAIGASTAIAAPVILDEQSLDLVELLRADLDESADPGARAVAVRVLAESVVAVADELAGTALEPVADTEQIRVPSGVTVTVSPSGVVEQDWKTRAAQRLQASAPSSSGPIGFLVTGALLAVVGVVVTIVAGPGALAMVVVGAGLAGYGGWQLRSGRAQNRSRTDLTLRKADEAVAEKVKELQGKVLELQMRQGNAPGDCDAIRAAVRAAQPVDG